MNNDTPMPVEGFLRLADVLAKFPVSPAVWYEGVKEGRYPKPVKLGNRAAGYKVQDIRHLLETGSMLIEA